MAVAQTQILIPQVHIKRPSDDGLDDGLDALIRGYTTQKPDERRKVKVVGENKLGRMFRFYLEEQHHVNFLDGFERIPRLVLTPSEINSLLNAIILFDDEKEAIEYKLSVFVTQLIKKSYTVGYNNFVLDFSQLEKQTRYLGKNLVAKPKNPIYIKIYGDLSDDCGLNAKYVHFDIDGNVNSPCLGVNAEHCSFTITGNVKGIYLGAHILGWSGKACSFKTPNKKTLETFKMYIPNGYNHMIYFIHPNGTEELIKRKITKIN
ncbi:hypothetical protein J4434_08780 [Candidatus Woesearchaeota archaeon]|nr:hypothetical protein [Candidatus Woesearchaeota archaeon]